jgi:hypothetical protein
MNWATIREAIRQAVVSASGLSDTAAVQWRGTCIAGGWRPDPHVDLVLKQVAGLGVDEARASVQSGNLVTTLTGNRTLSVSIRVESQSQADGVESVGAIAGRIRTRLRRLGILTALKDADLALVEIQPVQNLDFASQGRFVSLAVLDVLLSSVENDTDTTPESADWFDTVLLSSDTLDGVDGLPLPEQVDETITGA